MKRSQAERIHKGIAYGIRTSGEPIPGRERVEVSGEQHRQCCHGARHHTRTADHIAGNLAHQVTSSSGGHNIYSEVSSDEALSVE